MNLLFLLNTFVALLILIFLGLGFFKHYQKNYINKVTNWFSVIFFSYVLLFVIYVAWFFKFLSFSANDYIFIYAIAIFVQTLILFKIVYSFTKNKKTLYFLLSYFILFLLLGLFSFYYVLLMSLVISFFLTLIFSFNFVNTSRICKRVGYIGVFYASVSLILGFFLFFNIGGLLFFSLVSNFIFFFFIFFFLRDIEKYPLRFVEQIHTGMESHIVLFIKYFVYIIVLTNFVLISTIGVHELSHVIDARYYGCEARSIVFEKGNYPYSEIICNDLSNKIPIALSGPVVPIIIALFLFLIGGKFIRPISFLIIGFNLLASYKDFLELSVGKSLILASSVIGIIFIFIGVAFLAISRIHEHPL